MALQERIVARNARLDALETATGASAKLKIWTGAPPATCALADSGTLIVAMNLPVDWMNAASLGSKNIAGVWSGVAVATDTAGHFRIYETTGTDAYLQGTITATGGGGDMELNTVSITTGDTVTISTFTITAGNA